jgi:hypothetical protein
MNLSPGIWARWFCESCGSLLRFDLSRRYLLAALAGVGIIVLQFWVFPYVPLWVSTILVFAGLAAIMRVERIVLAESVAMPVLEKR